LLFSRPPWPSKTSSPATKRSSSPLIAPIGGGPGADVSFDDTFEKVKARSRAHLDVGRKVDWAAISSGCDELLADKGKDFRVALYYLPRARTSTACRGCSTASC